MQLIAARRNMINTGFYLSDDSFHDEVAWAQEGHATCLSIKPETLDADDTSDGDSLKYPSPPPEGIDVVPICAVVKISDNDSWLTADAGYHGPLQIWKDFSDVKASCATEQPGMAPFKDDYPIVVKNLHWLLDTVATPKFSGKKGLLIWSSDTEANLDAHFKVHHKLFEQLDHDEVVEHSVHENNATEEDKNNTELNGESSVFAIQNWPTFHDVAASALDAIKDTHQVLPLPAYGMDGKLIEPQMYCCHLQGALVELYFALSHWAIGKRCGSPGNDVYAADIVMICVLALPCSTTAGTPKKWKVANLYVDPSSSPKNSKLCHT
ncbi:hypothetical protein EDC04DRAFT_2894047 [Pisolithus marmoratus]|nr:hypothetical protein EDC04DRAFT_2894047 [Pisolithus marmoratus]